MILKMKRSTIFTQSQFYGYKVSGKSLKTKASYKKKCTIPLKKSKKRLQIRKVGQKQHQENHARFHQSTKRICQLTYPLYLP